MGLFSQCEPTSYVFDVTFVKNHGSVLSLSMGEEFQGKELHNGNTSEFDMPSLYKGISV